METTINDDMLTRFLANDLSDVEQEQVMQWISASPENRLHFLELQDAWELAGLQPALDQALEGINIEEKWASFRQSVEVEDNTEGEEALSAQYISIEEGRAKRSWLVPAIAASVLVVLGFGWLLLRQQPVTAVVADKQPENKATQLTEQREVNYTGKNRTIYLPDSSVITLHDSSEITYRAPFTDRRTVTLTGMADFTVSHDTARPFTVYSKEVSTTVLGTEFTVTAWPAGRRISVRLYTGKVVVKPIDATHIRMKKEVFLLPGQEFIFDGVARVNWFRKKQVDAAVVHDKQQGEDPLVPDNSGATWYMFNNQPTEQVLKQLSALYGVAISYNKRDLRNSYFTAQYRSTDSLETILERIARLNKLTITKNDNGYKLSK